MGENLEEKSIRRRQKRRRNDIKEGSNMTGRDLRIHGFSGVMGPPI